MELIEIKVGPNTITQEKSSKLGAQIYKSNICNLVVLYLIVYWYQNKIII